jgi:formate hydrogenlyase subunit 3/multisubunit Na+/H+ antiporter MnhD subunit
MDLIHLSLFLAIGLPLLGSPFVALAGKRLGSRVGWLALAFPILSTILILFAASHLPLPGRHPIEWPWIPTLGINLSFVIDGLSLFFGLVVSGMGVFDFLLRESLSRRPLRASRAVLLLSHAVHGGDVGHGVRQQSDAAVHFLGTHRHFVVPVDWISAWGRKLAGGCAAGVARHGADRSGVAGGRHHGSHRHGHLQTSRKSLATGLPLEEHKTWLTVAMVLIVIGAFGKSAQFPFHFWLPNAMAAPTPVSAYLHSATMVKLGVFLCARIFPLFNEVDLWTPLLTIIPFTTMALARCWRCCRMISRPFSLSPP